MKHSYLIVVLLFISSMLHAQSVATDFTTTDCNSVSHNLFTELNAGGVVVITWVMPCHYCVDGSNAGWNAAQSFATSNPGKVKFFLVDDFGDNTCSDLATWVTTNSVAGGNPTSFDNVGQPIKMTDYGTGGMPKVVVIGGSSHYVYFNENFSAANNQVAITNAISQALTGATPTALYEVKRNPLNFTPVIINGEMTLPNVQFNKLVITDLLGKIVYSNQQVHSDRVALQQLENGLYAIRLFQNESLVAQSKFAKQ